MDIEEAIELIDAAIQEYYEARQYISFLSQNLTALMIDKRDGMSYEAYKKKVEEETMRALNSKYEDKELIRKENEKILETFFKKRGE